MNIQRIDDEHVGVSSLMYQHNTHSFHSFLIGGVTKLTKPFKNAIKVAISNVQIPTVEETVRS